MDWWWWKRRGECLGASPGDPAEGADANPANFKAWDRSRRLVELDLKEPDHHRSLDDLLEWGGRLPGRLRSVRGRTARTEPSARGRALAGVPGPVAHARRRPQQALPGNADTGFADLRTPSLDVIAADLVAVDVPALVIAGDTSHPALRSVAHRLAAALADARFIELADCGHVTYA